jgi:hypothetical protein
MEVAPAEIVTVPAEVVADVPEGEVSAFAANETVPALAVA